METIGLETAAVNTTLVASVISCTILVSNAPDAPEGRAIASPVLNSVKNEVLKPLTAVPVTDTVPDNVTSDSRSTSEVKSSVASL